MLNFLVLLFLLKCLIADSIYYVGLSVLRWAVTAPCTVKKQIWALTRLQLCLDLR